MDYDFNPREFARRRSMLLIDPEKTKLRYAKAILYPLLLSASTIRLTFITTDDGFDRIYVDDDYVEILDSWHGYAFTFVPLIKAYKMFSNIMYLYFNNEFLSVN